MRFGFAGYEEFDKGVFVQVAGKDSNARETHIRVPHLDPHPGINHDEDFS